MGCGLTDALTGFQDRKPGQFLGLALPPPVGSPTSHFSSRFLTLLIRKMNTLCDTWEELDKYWMSTKAARWGKGGINRWMDGEMDE